MCVIWNISWVEEKQSTALFCHKRLVMLTVIINRCDGRRQRKDWIIPWEDPAAMMHSLLSSLKEIHRDRRFIWSTTKHNTAISKKHPANDWPLWDLARAFWDAISPMSACFSFAPLVSRSVGHGLLRLELCLFSSSSPMCCAGQRETLTGIFQRVTSVWLAGCHPGNVRPVSAVSTRAVVARLIGDDGQCFLGMPDPIRWLRERMTGQKKNEEWKTFRFSWQGWRRSAQTLCVIERRKVTSCNWVLAVKVWDYSWS